MFAAWLIILKTYSLPKIFNQLHLADHVTLLPYFNFKVTPGNFVCQVNNIDIRICGMKSE